jgi:hypothetical protein
LIEALNDYSDRISFFSGEELNVNEEDDLSGECVFFFALHPPKPYMGCTHYFIGRTRDEKYRGYNVLLK